MQISKTLFDLFKDLRDSVIALDSELNITHVNRSQVNIFSIDPDKLIGKNIYEIDPKIAENIFSEEILEAVARKEITSCEWEDIYKTNLWRTTIFPSTDGVTMISRVITYSSKSL